MPQRVVFVLTALLAIANCHPTMYKLNDKKLLEPDLIPVSSTVIPIPIHEIHSSVSVGFKDLKFKGYDDGLLITKENRYEAHSQLSPNDVSSIKEI